MAFCVRGGLWLRHGGMYISGEGREGDDEAWNGVEVGRNEGVAMTVERRKRVDHKLKG